MTPARPTGSALVAPLLAILSMAVFQLGAAVSMPLLLRMGPVATTWLRLAGACLALAVYVRPRRADYAPHTLRAAALLGLATGGMSVFFAESITRIPLGMAAGTEFAGPLAVALFASRRPRDFLWVVVAVAGIVLILPRGGAGGHGAAGVAFALAAACCWAAYILLTKRVGRMFAGLHGLFVSLGVAALVMTPFAVPDLLHGATPRRVALALGLGVLVPLLPYSLEMLALRRMRSRNFGILMSLDPAMSALAGLAVLGQVLAWPRLLGIGCVVAASIGTNAGPAREA